MMTSTRFLSIPDTRRLLNMWLALGVAVHLWCECVCLRAEWFSVTALITAEWVWIAYLFSTPVLLCILRGEQVMRRSIFLVWLFYVGVVVFFAYMMYQ